MERVRVLVVDDATFIRDLIKKALRSAFAGIEIDDVVDGRKALKLLETTRYDLILCDWEMPEMSGLELLSWCRGQARLQQVPFIMVTSRGDRENVVQAIQAGVSDYVGKPFSNEQLLAKVRKAFSRSGQLERLQGRVTPPSQGFGNDSLAALTGGSPAVVTPPKAAAAPASRPAPAQPAARRPAVAKAARGAPGGKGQGVLRLAAGSMACIVKAMSLKEALLLVRRGDVLPQVMETAVLDLQQGEQQEIARLNGYLHALAGHEPSPETEWLQLTFRFVDADPQKLDYISRLIASGSTQRHYVPGA